jgi:hypothetical protein
MDQLLLMLDQKSDPSAAFGTGFPKVGATQLTGSGGAVTGDIVLITYNFTPQGGSARPVDDTYFVAVGHKSDGSLEAMFINLFAPQSAYNDWVRALPITAMREMTLFSDVGP